MSIDSVVVKPLSLQDIPSLRRLHIWSMKHATSDLSGAFHSTFRGTGLEFRDLREYVPGDEIKHIHWRASARSGKVFVKTYDEERSLRIHIALDCSASTFFQNRFKTYQSTAALLAKLAERSGDKISATFFADKTLEYISPVKGRSQAKKIISRICKINALHNKTDINEHCEFLEKHLRHKTIIIILSDFISADFTAELQKLARSHLVVLATSLEPPLLPNTGLIQFKDPETGSLLTLDTGCPSYKVEINKIHEDHIQRLKLQATALKGRFLGIGISVVQSILQFSKFQRK